MPVESGAGNPLKFVQLMEHIHAGHVDDSDLFKVVYKTFGAKMIFKGISMSAQCAAEATCEAADLLREICGYDESKIRKLTKESSERKKEEFKNRLSLLVGEAYYLGDDAFLEPIQECFVQLVQRTRTPSDDCLILPKIDLCF